ncbi:MAG: hypothetical protein QM784_10595 [Polyangiaceae bacterium]
MLESTNQSFVVKNAPMSDTAWLAGFVTSYWMVCTLPSAYVTLSRERPQSLPVTSYAFHPAPFVPALVTVSAPLGSTLVDVTA